MKILPLFICLFFSLSIQALPAKGHKIMISAPSEYAIEAGKIIINKGGNVVDVAVTVGLTLAVTLPYFAAFGGGGFALVKMKNKPVDVLDFREMAPQAAHEKLYVGKDSRSSRDGGLAVGVPGVPAGLWELHKKYGKLHWSQLFQYPIRLAQRGFHVTGKWSEKTLQNQKRMNSGGKKHFFKKNGQHYKPGEKLVQKPLAKVLKEMQNRNIISFYKGQVARDIVSSVKKSNGILSLQDMKNYKVRWLKPLVQNYDGHKVYLMPPPSSGGVVIASTLRLIEKLKLKDKEPLSVEELHYWSEILKGSFRGRSLLGDPDFHTNPISQLLSHQYLNSMAQSFSPHKVTEMTPLGAPPSKESSQTTHFSVLDAKGNAVSLTVTLNGYYGSGVVSERFGIALNNEMDDFTTQPGKPNMFGLIQGKGNLVQPGKRPLSSMSPTLVEKDGKVILAIGAPGGPRIISGVVQALYRIITNKFDIDTAIQAPRVHHQFLPKKVFIDKHRMQPATMKGLTEKGHTLEKSWNSIVYGVQLKPNGILEAAFDSRGEGAAGGF